MKSRQEKTFCRRILGNPVVLLLLFFLMNLEPGSKRENERGRRETREGEREKGERDHKTKHVVLPQGKIIVV